MCIIYLCWNQFLYLSIQLYIPNTIFLYLICRHFFCLIFIHWLSLKRWLITLKSYHVFWAVTRFHEDWIHKVIWGAWLKCGPKSVADGDFINHHPSNKRTISEARCAKSILHDTGCPETGDSARCDLVGIWFSKQLSSIYFILPSGNLT